MRETREKCEELAMTMEFLGAGAIKTLRNCLKKYYEDHENDNLRTKVDNEIESLIKLADKNRKHENIAGKIGDQINSTVEEDKVCED